MDSLGLLISSNCVLRSNYWELVASPMILASHCYLQSPRVVPTTDRRPVPSTFAHESTRSLPCQPSGLKPQPRLLLPSAFRGVHAAHKQVDVVVTTARFWRNSGFILGGMRARRGDSSLGANQARKHSVGHTRMFVSRFVVVSPVAVVMSESPLELAGLFQYHITSNSRNY